VRVFKVSWFSKFAAKEGIQDGELRDIVDDVLEAGKADADLGGSVYKIRTMTVAQIEKRLKNGTLSEIS
jgi:hypothetical protein